MRKIYLFLGLFALNLLASSVAELESLCLSDDNSTACNTLGVFYTDGEGVDRDYKKAYKFYSMACRDSNPFGCNNLGYVYESGQAVRQDKALAKEFYGVSCDLGEQVGCDKFKELNEEGF